MKQINIFDEVIEECCSNPITGYFRDGFFNSIQFSEKKEILGVYVLKD